MGHIDIGGHRRKRTDTAKDRDIRKTRTQKYRDIGIHRRRQHIARGDTGRNTG